MPAISNASGSDLQWIVDSYALVFCGLLFVAATLGDRFGRKGALQIGLVLFAGSAVAGALATSSGQVIVARAVMGVGAACVMPSTLSILSNVFPNHERGRAISLWAGISAGAAALGPPISGVLLSHFWWGSVFLVVVPIAVAGLVVGHFLIPKSRDPNSTPVDVPGVLMSVVAIVALIDSIIEAPHRGWGSLETAIGFAVAAVALLMFIAIERRVEHPMLDLALFRDRRFSVASAGTALVFFALFGSFFLLTQVLQLVFRQSPMTAGLMLLPSSVVLMTLSPRAAGLVERFGAATMVPVGLAFVAAAMVGFAVAVHQGAVWWIYLGIVPTAIGVALALSPLTTLIMVSVPRARAGMGSAMNDVTRELGGAFGVAVLGSVTTTAYVRQLPALGGLGPEASKTARSGLAGALQVADQWTGGPPATFARAATEAFINGAMMAGLVGAVAVAAAAIMSRRLLARSGGRAFVPSRPSV